MNHKQKLGYMVLGAGIMAIGIIIGQWGTPDIEAQSDGVFDKITCRELEVVNEKGETGIGLVSDRRGNRVSVYDKQEKVAIELSHLGSIECRSLYVANEEGKLLVKLGSSIMKSGGYVGVFDENENLVGQIIGEGGNSFGLFDKIKSRELEVRDKIEVLGTLEVRDKIKADQITVINREGKPAIELDGSRDNIVVYSISGEKVVGLGNLGISVYDEHEKVGISLSSTRWGNSIDIYDKNQKTGLSLSTSESDNEIYIRGKHDLNGVRLGAFSDIGNAVVVYSNERDGYPRVHLGSGTTFHGVALNGVAVLDKGNVEWASP